MSSDVPEPTWPSKPEAGSKVAVRFPTRCARAPLASPRAKPESVPSVSTAVNWPRVCPFAVLTEKVPSTVPSFVVAL